MGIPGDDAGPRLNGKPAPAALAGITDRGLHDLSDLLKSLADPSRLRVLFLLAENGEMNVTAIGQHLGQSQPAVSHHLNQLKKAGLIAYRRDGKFNYYRLSPDGLDGLAGQLFPDGRPKAVPLGSLELVFRSA